jgi:hypothetical protein
VENRSPLRAAALAPGGTLLDLNGVVKALAVDASLDLLRGDGFVAAGGTSRHAAAPSSAFRAEARYGSSPASSPPAARAGGAGGAGAASSTT